MPKFIPCSVRQLEPDKWVKAAASAIHHNPANRPMLERLPMVVKDFTITHAAIAVVTTKYWGRGGVHLSVSFMDNPATDLRKRILLHMNAWSAYANVKFSETKGHGQVRILRAGGEDGGYWSYVGTDIEHIPAGEATMNLEAFTMRTPESEFHRVVRHETGHTLGCPHEHMRKELVDRIDVKKAIKYFAAADGWNEQTVRQQVLTPISEASIMGTEHTDQDSIMCYQLPATITKDGKPIRGGIDIDATDGSFMARCYPPVATPPKPAPGKKSAPKRAKAGTKKTTKRATKKATKRRTRATA